MIELNAAQFIFLITGSYLFGCLIGYVSNNMFRK